jgi:hypothetical protein
MDPATPGRFVVPLAALTILLSRFAAQSLSPAAEPAVQATVNLAITLAVVLLGLAGPGWRSNLRLSASPLMLGVGLYAAAAVFGGVVALARGNESHLLAGQLLAMGLLPLAALGGWMLGSAAGVRRFATAVSAMSCAACLAAFTFGFVRLASGQDPKRFSFPNGMAPTGMAMLASLLALALGATSNGWKRRLAFTAAGIVAAYSIASTVRSLWLAGAFAVLAFAPLAWGAPAVLGRRVLRAVGELLAFAAAVMVLATLWWGHTRPDILGRMADRRPTAGRSAAQTEAGPDAVHPSEATSETGVRVVRTPEVPAGTYRLRGEVLFGGPGRAQVCVGPAGAIAELEPIVADVILATEAGARSFSEVVVSKAPAASLDVRLRDMRGVSEGIKATSLERLGPVWLGSLISVLNSAIHRPVDPDETPGAGAFAGDASIREFLRSSWTARLLGHGLGARFDFTAAGYDRQGQVVRFENPNYIHNFYVFLLFKLGIVGLVLVGAALLLWTLVPAKAALRFPAGDPRRIFLAASAAAWFGYSVWSLAAPEILDFRLAPLWGFLLATTSLPAAGAAELSTRPGSACERQQASSGAGRQPRTSERQ